MESFVLVKYVLKFYVFLQGTEGNWAKFCQPGYYGHIHATDYLFSRNTKKSYKSYLI